MKMTNNQFGRLELTLQRIESGYIYTKGEYIINPDIDTEKFFLDLIILWNISELNNLIDSFKDIWNKGKDISIDSIN